MTKHKVSELAGMLLDKAVGLAEAGNGSVDMDDHQLLIDYAPSRNWHQAGPIIERALIAVVPSMDSDMEGPLTWHASVGAYSHYIDESLPFTSYKNEPPVGSGATPLIAAMRAYVASKFGEEIELP